MAETVPSPDLIAGLYSAAVGFGSWSEALSRFCDAVAADHVIVRGGPALPFLQSTRVDERSLREAVRAGMEVPYDGPDLSTFAPGGVGVRSQFVPDARFERSAYYQHVIRPMGGFHALCGVGTEAAPGSAILICRRREQGDFESHHAQMVSALLPHVSAAIALTQRQNQQPNPADVLETFDAAALICDADGRVVLGNSASRRLLDRDANLLLVRGALAGRNPTETARLRRCIESVAIFGEPSVVIRLGREADRPVLLVRIVRLGSDGFAQPALAAIIVSDPQVPRRVDSEALLEAYRLSSREAEIAARLALGQSVDVIAGATGLQIGSVRSYLKRIFAKTGVHSQAALVALVRSVG